MRVFGPVPSRRLGRSIGINNIPAKVCSLSCVYCQVGRGGGRTAERGRFFSPEELMLDVRGRIEECRRREEKVDYLTVVPDGEPTLDLNLGKLLRLLGNTGIHTAVITNSTLMGSKDVRNDLMEADLISVKVDSAEEDVWKCVNRPVPGIHHQDVLHGLELFSRRFTGKLITETMMVAGLNDSRSNAEKTARFISGLNPNKCYIGIPTRPPAEPWVMPPEGEAVGSAWQAFNEEGLETEYLMGYEGNAFSSTGDLRRDLLSITAVHPMRREAVTELAEKCSQSMALVDDMISAGEIMRSEYRGHIYYMRRIGKRD